MHTLFCQQPSSILEYNSCFFATLVYGRLIYSVSSQCQTNNYFRGIFALKPKDISRQKPFFFFFFFFFCFCFLFFSFSFCFLLFFYLKCAFILGKIFQIKYGMETWKLLKLRVLLTKVNKNGRNKCAIAKPCNGNVLPPPV